MITTTFAERRRQEALGAKQLAAHQLRRLNRLLKAILPQNRFYANKLAHLPAEALADADGPLRSLDELADLPFTFKDELLSCRRLAGIGREPDVPARARTSAFTRRRGRAAGRWWCSTRPTIGPGGSIVGSSCSTRPALTAAIGCSWPFRSARSSDSGARSTPLRPRLAGGARRRTDDAGAAGDDSHDQSDGRILHAQLRFAPGRSRRGPSDRRRRAGRARARAGRRSEADRCPRPAAVSRRPGKPGSSIMPARRKSALGATATKPEGACTSTRTTSSPSFSTSKPAPAPPRESSPNWC